MGRGLVIFIVLIVIGAVLYFVFRKTPDKKVVSKTGDDTIIVPVPPCELYTQEMKDNDMKAIRRKCAPRLALGILGRYGKCISDATGELPPINNC